MTKNNERIIYKKTRSNIDKKIDKKIISNFLNTKEYKESELLLIYYPLNEEINTLPIIQKAFQNHKKVALPKCQQNEMFFCIISDLVNLKVGLFKIMEPSDNHIVTDFNNSICIVPGIAFDKDFNRLGYGKGYYDRFLINYPGLKIGLCYEDLFVNKLTTDHHDIPVDIIITEKDIYKRQ